MNVPKLVAIARSLLAGDKGLRAMDESTPTCNKRFASLGIPQTEEFRRAYRELLVGTPGLSDSISGAILCDETIRQRTKDGIPFVKALGDGGIVPGIKVDAGAKVLMDGAHTLKRCFEISEEVLRMVFDQLYTLRVTLEARP